MLAFFANIFGYVLKLLYNIVGNYGWAIILFSVLVKVLMLPISMKQQKTLKKNEKIQGELKQLQFKYKNEPEKLNQEMMALYKREGMSPFSGCLSSIVQIILLFSIFLLVRQPLTYMVKMDQDAISKIGEIVTKQDNNTKNAYQEIAIIQYVKNLQNNNSVENNEEVKEVSDKEKVEEKNEKTETTKTEKSNTESFDIEKYADQANLNMDFLGIDLSQVPTKNPTDIKVLIIPILYVISSFISIRISSSTTKKKKNEEKKLITDGTEQEEKYNPTEDMSKTMVWMMPIMSVTIAIIAPLGLALYWLMNNVLMIIERLVLNKILNKEEEAEADA
ncbi:MAG: membrane protein insertase YidC [Clostridia bacterium]|nr:membrane protein insertase YidC [Clostridia bacterium]